MLLRRHSRSLVFDHAPVYLNTIEPEGIGMLSMAGKVAIVAGAGSVGPTGSKIWGNGKTTAVLLARQGASVFLLDIDEAAMAATKSIIEAEGGTCTTHRCDMTVAARWRKWCGPVSLASHGSTSW